jgi:hypothetical protein
MDAALRPHRAAQSSGYCMSRNYQATRHRLLGDEPLLLGPFDRVGDARVERGTRPLRVAEAAAIATIFRVPPLAVFLGPAPTQMPQKAARAWLDEITAAQVTGTYVAPKAGRVSVGDPTRSGLVIKAFEGNYGRHAGLYVDISCGTPLGTCRCS